MSDTPINNNDLIELQWMAARYAHDRKTFATDIMNQITLKMIKNGVYPQRDRTRDAPEPTVWVRDGDFGWPEDLIAEYGWDGRKQKTT